MTDPILLQSTGDVVGPVSATDGSMVLFDGISGKAIKGNNAIVTAAGIALLDDNNATEQRNTLGLGTIATQNSNAVTISGGNITGITDLAVADGGTGASTAPQARTNLGILFGTTAGTYMEGNDSRVVNAVPNTRQIIAGVGLAGGGDLTANRTVSLGAPSTITNLSNNSVSGTTHDHKIDLNSFFGDKLLAEDGYYTLPGGLIIQWGKFYTGAVSNNEEGQAVFLKPFLSSCFKVILGMNTGRISNVLGNTEGMQIIDKTITGFTWKSNWQSRQANDGACDYIAIGI